MGDINFLDNKKQEEEKPENIKKENIAWSEPEKQEDSRGSRVFSFLPFIKKNGKQPVFKDDKNKIKKSRKEILNLIKHHENSNPEPKKKYEKFFCRLAGKFKKQLDRKGALIDYRRVFDEENNKKQPEIKNHAVETVKSVQAYKPEIVVPAIAEEKNYKILKTNLIQGEIVTFFDWRSKAIISAIAISVPVFITVAAYFGLGFYQKNSQSKNSEQARIFADLEKKIAEEESGILEMLNFQEKLKIVSKVFEKHIYWTNFFKFLEDNTIKNVYFTSFDGDTSGNYSMEALASDYGSISEQAGVFKNNKKITFVEAGGGETVSGDGKNKTMVKFDLNFSILNGIFTE